MNDMPRGDDGRPENDPGSTAGGGHDDGWSEPHEEGVVDESVDRHLRSSGAELRDRAPAMDGNQIVVQRLESKLRRSRRNGFVAVGVAAALLAATVGFVVTDDKPTEIAAGGDGALAPGSPEAIVEGLPPEPVDPHDVDMVASVSRFESCTPLLDDLRKVGAAHVGSLGFGNSELGPIRAEGYATVQPMSFAGPGDTDISGMAMSDYGYAGETLGTNVIVEGVDEPDRVKASGNLVVDISDLQLRVVDTTAGAIVGTMTLGNPFGDDDRIFAAPSSLLLEGDRAVVFGDEIVESEAVGGDPSAGRRSLQYTTITFVDLSDPANPSQVDRIRLEGHLVAARRVDGQVRIVTGTTMQDLPLVMPSNPSSVPVALEQNRLAVAGSSVDDWIPGWDNGEGTDAHRLVDCDRVVVPDTFAGVQMTSLVAFDMAGPFEPSATGVLAPSDDITATAEDVVVSSQIWVDPAERDEGYEDWSSALHRFSFSDGAPVYVASGEVPGSIRDDFSLAMLDDATVGVLTVDVLPWEERAKAKVTARTLATDGEVLEPLGVLDVASGENGSAGMRFIGSRLLVSTGLAGNHLMVIDLADPAAPVSTGEVDLEGSGAYFHPLEGDRVLAVGQAWRTIQVDARPSASPRDLSVTLLDLSGAPQVVASSRTPDMTSEVGDDHHAFTWWPQRSTAAFGVTHLSPDDRSLAPAPEAMFVGVQGEILVPTVARPNEAYLGPRCPFGQLDRTGCDDTGPPMVDRVLVVGGELWLYTSESLERFDVNGEGVITTATPADMVVLPPPGH